MTLLDAAGLPIPERMQGRSALSLVRRGRADWPEEVFIHISEAQVSRAVRTHRWKYSVVAPRKVGREESASDRHVEEFLYDLEPAPYELANLVGLEWQADVAAVMRERLVRRMAEAGEPELAI